MTRIAVLGAGTGGTIVANRLARRFGPRATVTVVDRDDDHLYQPGLLTVPFGLDDPAALVRPRHRQLRSGVDFVPCEIVRIDADRVHLADGRVPGYDVLGVATGCRLLPEQTDDLTEPGWRDTVHDFYSPEGAGARAAAGGMPRRAARRRGDGNAD